MSEEFTSVTKPCGNETSNLLRSSPGNFAAWMKGALWSGRRTLALEGGGRTAWQPGCPGAPEGERPARLRIHQPSPQPAFDPADVDTHLVGMPLGFAVAKILGKQDAELDAPHQNGFAGHPDSAFQEQFFDICNIPVAEGKAVIEPQCVADQGDGKPVAWKLLTAQRRVTLPQQPATTLPW